MHYCRCFTKSTGTDCRPNFNVKNLIFVIPWLLLTDVKPFDELYADGIEAYWNENWEGCIHYLEEALTSYR